MLRRILGWIRDLFFSKAPVQEEERPREAMVQPLEDRQFLSVAASGVDLHRAEPMLVTQGSIISDPIGTLQRRGNIVGKWRGTVTARGETIRVVLRVTSTRDGVIRGEVKSPDFGEGWFPFKVKGGVSREGVVVATYRNKREGVRATMGGQVNADGKRASGVFKVVQEGETVRGTFEVRRV